MRRAVILVVLTLLCAGSCADDAKAPVQGGGVAIATTKAPPTTTTTARPTTTTTKKPAPLPSKAQLTAELVTLRDLPSDWRVDTRAEDPAAEPACLKALDDGVSKTTVKASFVSGDGFPTLGETLDTYRADQMGPELAKAAHILDTCGSFTVSSGGIVLSGKITRVASFPLFGDQTLAWDMELQAQGVVANVALVLVAQGTTALSFTYGVRGDDAVSPTQTYLSVATAKL